MQRGTSPLYEHATRARFDLFSPGIGYQVLAEKLAWEQRAHHQRVVRQAKQIDKCVDEFESIENDENVDHNCQCPTVRQKISTLLMW